jgi:hypothetical protein
MGWRTDQSYDDTGEEGYRAWLVSLPHNRCRRVPSVKHFGNTAIAIQTCDGCPEPPRRSGHWSMPRRFSGT